MGRKTRKFLSYYRPYVLRFGLVLLCALISAAAAILFPLCVRQITDLALEGEDLSRLLYVGGIMLGLAVIGSVSGFCFDYFGHCVGADMENDLRQELFSHLEKLSFSFYDRHRVGELMSSLTNDLCNLAELYHHGPEDYLVNSVKFVGASAILFVIDWRLTLCMYVFLVPMAVLTIRLNRKARTAAAKNQHNIAEINARAEDSLAGIRVSQAFNRQETEKKLFAKAGTAFLHSRKEIYFTEAVEYQVLQALTQLMNIAVIILGLTGIFRGVLAVGDWVAFLMYIGYLTEPVQKLAWMTTQYQQGIAGFERVLGLLDTEPEIRDLPGAGDAGILTGDIEFRHVTFRYSENNDAVLDDISLNVPEGSCLAVTGISGVGKTTICSLLPRFYDPQDGVITIGGEDIQGFTLDSLRRNISVVQQDTYLFSGSVMENIRYGRPDASDEMVMQAARAASADGFIRALPEGYATDVGPKGVRLSGGQRQRIAIARAFLRDTPILILDEATSALDSESERAIHAALARLRKGRTTIMVAHRLSTIREADRICVMREGKISEQGTYEELIHRQGEFSRIYDIQEDSDAEKRNESKLENAPGR